MFAASDECMMSMCWMEREDVPAMPTQTMETGGLCSAILKMWDMFM